MWCVCMWGEGMVHRSKSHCVAQQLLVISIPLYSLGSPVHLCTALCCLQVHNHGDRYSGKSFLPQLTKGGHITFPLMSREGEGGGGGGRRWTQEQLCMKEKEVKVGEFAHKLSLYLSPSGRFPRRSSRYGIQTSEKLCSSLPSTLQQ